MTNQQSSRLEILNHLSQNLEMWDGSSEEANEIVEKNQTLLVKLKNVDRLLTDQGNGEYTKEEQKQVAAIIDGQKSLLAIIQKDRAAILDKMKQMNQKDKVVDNYYTSFQQPIFVDRGM